MMQQNDTIDSKNEPDDAYRIVSDRRKSKESCTSHSFKQTNEHDEKEETTRTRRLYIFKDDDDANKS